MKKILFVRNTFQHTANSVQIVQTRKYSSEFKSNTFFKKALPIHLESQELSSRHVLEKALKPHKTNEILIKCTEFDASGGVKVVSGEFKKADLCSKHGLLPRDLRKIDTGIQSLVPSILVRKSSILINLLHIRALLKADAVLLFNVYGSTDTHTQSVFMYDLEGKLRQGSKAMGGLPYEFRALEAILISVSTALNAEMKFLNSLVKEVLLQLEEDINRERIRNLLIYSKKVSAFAQKVTLIRNALNEILDQGITLYYIDFFGKIRPLNQHDEIELLLESYLKQTDEIVQSVNNLVSNIKNTEEIVNIVLDANRNSLMLMELKVSILTLAVSSGAIISGLLGMNLKNFMEHLPYAFAGISSLVFTIATIVGIFGLKKIKKIQRLTLWGKDHMIVKR
ncbi:uncharacterized protein T551_00217 [Pneumocystis jirovecii RU7]|uniref:Magnesium transporter n=1 Tax=Pneumocystis jirovecii (strain RU7) TaxID=1408657 RepID=A0A0W4ZWI8_PNEJ7|nr:uncharacterized protein T551_00217 [Pneumocystis jirovecii RU7]KTW32732.1 hypothetical protein T551_00217 [Pneumocystis jirovecii RU7]